MMNSIKKSGKERYLGRTEKQQNYMKVANSV
jgi:hypothetical protein